jgi:hypothetical protein
MNKQSHGFGVLNDLSWFQWILILIAFYCLLSCGGKTEVSKEPELPVVIYTSKTGDKVIKPEGLSSIVWVEDKDGNIKAIARH